MKFAACYNAPCSNMHCSDEDTDVDLNEIALHSIYPWLVDAPVQVAIAAMSKSQGQLHWFYYGLDVVRSCMLSMHNTKQRRVYQSEIA